MFEKIKFEFRAHFCQTVYMRKKVPLTLFRLTKATIRGFSPPPAYVPEHSIIQSTNKLENFHPEKLSFNQNQENFLYVYKIQFYLCFVYKIPSFEEDNFIGQKISVYFIECDDLI